MPILHALLPLFLFTSLAQESLQQTDRRLDELRQQVQTQQQAIGALTQRTDQLSKEVRDNRPIPPCDVSLELTGETVRTVPSNVNASVDLEFFSIVGKARDCFPAELRMAVTYVDAEGSAICNAVVDSLLMQGSVTQSFSLEVRPWDFQNFVRWKNEPANSNSGVFRRIRCFNDVPADVQPDELARVAAVRLHVLLLTPGGSVGQRQIRITSPATAPRGGFR